MSNSQNNHNWQEEHQPQITTSKSYALSGKIMLSSIIILFVVVVFLVIIHLYARCYIRRRNETRRRNRHNRSTRIVFYVDNNTVSPSTASVGLDSNVLKSLPVFLYSHEKDGSLPECAVCLSEFEDGEKGRVLPKCKHSFHTECIDMWFFSNSTCPLCRSPVEPVVEPDLVAEPGSTSVTDRRKGLIDIRIDVPSQNAENDFRLDRLTSPVQGYRSPGSRLMSFTRMLTMNRKSPSGVGPSGVTESDIHSVDESTRSDNVK